MSYILAIDQGTTSSRAIAFDFEGKIIATAQQAFQQYYPQPGWVEHDPLEILETVESCIKETLGKIDIASVAAVGITNQRETTVIWNRQTGKPIYPAIVWQSRQTAEICAQLRQQGLEPEIRYKTGLVLDPYFSGTKIKWILDHVDGARAAAQRGELCFGTIDSWLLWNLTEEKTHATDPTNASRTLLYNLHSGQWDDALCSALDVPKAILPEIYENTAAFGNLRKDLTGGRRIPITGIAGDQQAALFGQACFQPGDAKNTYGTGCFLLMNTDDKIVTSSQGLLTTVAWRLHGKTFFALEGSVFVAGSAIQWLRDELGIIAESAETLNLAGSLDSNEGVFLVPAFVGLGAPYWNSAIRGAIFGLTRGSGRAHLVRAALESVAYQTKDVLDVMVGEAGFPLKTLRVDGGMVQNDLLMQFQADLLEVQVERPAVAETTALGAAYLAGLGAGLWRDTEEIEKKRSIDRSYYPSGKDLSSYYSQWKRAVQAAAYF